MSKQTFTAEEVATKLKISKHTVYELIKRGELTAYRVGNMMRIDESDFEAFKDSMRTTPPQKISRQAQLGSANLQIVGSHDFLIEHLVKYVNKHKFNYALQPTYIGSLEGLMTLYREQADVAAIHLLDPTSHEYNLPFVKQLFVHEPITIIRLAGREQGFIVQKGNPKNISNWQDLTRSDVKLINRQKGAGTRFLLDSNLAKESISPKDINGYDDEEWSHLSTAAMVQREGADLAVGIRSAADQLNLDFLPISMEQFDLVFRWTDENKEYLQQLEDLITSSDFQESIEQKSGYDFAETGKIVFKTK